MAKITKEKFKTYGNVFDEFTNLNLFKLSSQGFFDHMVSTVQIGKESNVFSAVTKEDKQIIVKIYRLENCNFNLMYDYIKADPRYIGLKKKKRQIIFSWTQREYRNLLIAREGGVNVPIPLKFMHNIILLEFIGHKDPAPQLKNKMPTNPEEFYKKVIDNYKKLLKVELVHGDLSQFNILNHDDEPVFIDFSQSAPLKSPRGKELLQRDIKNLSNFFTKLDVDTSNILNDLGVTFLKDF